MNHIIRVFSYELGRNARRRSYLFTTFGIPLIGILLFFGWQLLGNNDSGTEAPPPEETAEEIEQVGYIDESGLFNGTDLGNISPYTDVETARAALEAGEIERLYIIDEDYAETGDVQLVVPRFSVADISTSPIRQLVVTNLAGDLDEGTLLRLQFPAAINEIELQPITTAANGEGDVSATDGTVRDEGADFLLAYGFAILFLFTVFTTNGYLMQSVIEEKENSLVEILLSSVRPVQLLTGKVLALGTLGLFQVAVWIAAIVFLISTQGEALQQLLPVLSLIEIQPGTLLILATYFIGGYLMFAAAFGAVGAISNSLQEGPQLTVIFILPAMIPLWVLGSFLADPNGTLPVLMSIFPITSPLAMTMRAVITTVPVPELMLSVGLLALTVVAAFWAAGRLFRVQTLLAGQLPRWRDVPKLIFGS